MVGAAGVQIDEAAPLLGRRRAGGDGRASGRQVVSRAWTDKCVALSGGGHRGQRGGQRLVFGWRVSCCCRNPGDLPLTANKHVIDVNTAAQGGDGRSGSGGSVGLSGLSAPSLLSAARKEPSSKSSTV